MKDLSQYRAELDALDSQLVALFEKRMHVARDIALYKHAHQMNILDAAREDAVLQSRAAQVTEEELRRPTMQLFREIMRLSREEQRRILDSITETQTVAYMGVPGAFSESAVIGFFGDDCQRAHYKTFEDVFAAVARGEAKYGVVPIENSSSGSITMVYDLMGKYACHIVGEQLVRVEQCLLAVPGAQLEDIRTVYSHEQGFAQCPVFLGQHPEWEQKPYFNTAIAAQHVAQLGDKGNAAIASRLAARHYGLDVLVPDIHSKDSNHTRFFIVSTSPRPIGLPDKATLTFTVRHERGTLMHALSSFTAMGMNLTHIESRPLKDASWEYCFYVDLCGNVSEESLHLLMSSLTADCVNCRLLGAYRAAKV